jgi:hypothetical protein
LLLERPDVGDHPGVLGLLVAIQFPLFQSFLKGLYFLPFPRDIERAKGVPHELTRLLLGFFQLKRESLGMEKQITVGMLPEALDHESVG